MIKTSKNHKLLLDTEIILCNNPKGNGKICPFDGRITVMLTLGWPTKTVQLSISSVGKLLLKKRI